MGFIKKLKTKAVATAASMSPFFSKRLSGSYAPVEYEDSPWTPVAKPLCKSKVAMITTAGVHHRDQEPFDMADPDGDPTFRAIDAGRPTDSLMVTHDYYDRGDAEKDINVVFPIDRLGELKDEGIIGEVSAVHIGFMGHILGRHIDTLVNKTAPEVAAILKKECIDAVLLTPG